MCRTKIFKITNLGYGMKMFRYGSSQFNTIADTYNICIFGGAIQYFIPHKTTNQIAFHPKLFSGPAYLF